MRRSLGVADKKVFVYMPTWRGETLDTRSVQKYEEEVIEILNTLDKKVEDDTVIYVKLHQVVMNKIHLSSYKHIRCFDGSYDTYHFLSMADCLITDYSSVMFDFVNANKPIVLFMYDYDDYMRTRGMYMDVKSLGFEQAFSTGELVKFIKKFKKAPSIYHAEKDNFCAYDSADTPDLLNSVLLGGEPRKQVRIEDHSISNGKKFNLYLMPQLTTDERVRRFLEIKEKDADAVFVFAQETFTRKTEKLLQKYNDEITFIITPTKGLHSTLQLVRMRLALWGVTFGTKSLIRDEIDRISRGINVGKVFNFSKDKFFRFLDIADKGE